MIRKMEKQDKESFLTLVKAFYESEAVLHPIPHAYMERTFDYLVSGSPYADAYLTTSGGETAGYILLALTYSNEAGGMVLWIEELYIRPEFRGKGLGKSLLKFAEELYQDRVARIRLEVECENEKAAELYRRLGFSELGYIQMFKET